MHLIDLTVSRGDSVVRVVPFKRGLNLIIDKPTPTATQSGNSVGKTTVLRLVDFCLGSDGNDIWQDPEFNTVNQEVFDFLHGPVPVSVRLKVSGHARGTHSLRRTFPAGTSGKQTFQVHDVLHPKLKGYKDAVKQLLFGHGGDKPTLRQLAPKFVRSSPLLMHRTLRFLGDFATSTEYEALHLFLFGFFSVDILGERINLAAEKKRLDRDWEALNRIRGEGQIEQLLLLLRSEIEAIGLSPELRGEVPAIAARATSVSAIRAKAANLVADLGRIEAEIGSLGLTIQEIARETSDIDRSAIEAIYREAQLYIPKLHHDWKDLAQFVQELGEGSSAFSVRRSTSWKREQRARDKNSAKHKNRRESRSANSSNPKNSLRPLSCGPTSRRS